MRVDPAPARLTVLAASAGAAVTAVTAVAPWLLGGRPPSAADTAVAWALSAAAVALATRGRGRPAGLVLGAAAAWVLYGLAAVLPRAVETPLLRLSLWPHALLLMAVVTVTRGQQQHARSTATTALQAGAVAVAAVGDAGLYRHALLAFAVVAGLAAVLPAASGERLDAHARLLPAALALGFAASYLAGLLAPNGTVHVSVTDAVLLVVALALPVAATRTLDRWPALDGVDLRDGDALGAALGRALGTGPLTVAFVADTRSASSRWLDSAGRRVPAPFQGEARSSAAALAVVDEDGAVIAAVGPRTSIDPTTEESLRRLLVLAARGARLRGAVQGQADELAASRQRLLTAGDAERRQLEHQLGQGALATLDEVGVRLRALAGRSPSPAADPAVFADLAGRASTTRAELERLARGLDPLGRDVPLVEALAALVAHSRCPVALSVQLPPGQEPAESTARAVWFTCAEALANAAKHAPGAQVRIDVRHWAAGQDMLRLTVRDDGPGGASPDGSGLRGLADRAAALGGVLDVRSGVHGTDLVLELPMSLPEADAEGPADDAIEGPAEDAIEGPAEEPGTEAADEAADAPSLALLSRTDA